jgi:hypothetical protein
MKTRILLAAALAALPLAPAQAMDVAAFLHKADALEKKGMMALFSSDYKLLKGEVEAASGQLRAERLAAEKAGRRPAYCPGRAAGGLNSNELLAHLRTIPAAQRPGVAMKDALRDLYARKYPCPA